MAPGTELGASSAARREGLQGHIKVNDVLNSVPIAKYYALAGRTLEQAEKSWAMAQASSSQQQKISGKEAPTEENAAVARALRRYYELNECYVFYKRYGRLAIEVIPTHNYYGSPRCAAERKELARGQARCLEALTEIVAAMDADERLIDAERARRKREAEAQALEMQREREEAARIAREAQEAAERDRRESEERLRLKETLLAESRRRKLEQLRDEEARARFLKEEADRKAAEEAEKRRKEEERRRREAEALQRLKTEEEQRRKAEDEARMRLPSKKPDDSIFCKGAAVLYDDRGTWRSATIVKVHHEDDPPYYTVSVGGAGDARREVQTVRTKLREAQPPREEEEHPTLTSLDSLPGVGLPSLPPLVPTLKPPVTTPRLAEDLDARILGAEPLSAVAPVGGLDGGLLEPPTAPPAYTPSPTTQRPSSSAQLQTTPPKKKKARSVRELKEWYHKEWAKAGPARIESLSTYQGRTRDARGLDSTNGCAVIAPLTAYQHIVTRGASNDDISRLIDTVVPPILAHVRAKHGLGRGAFVIPADVHDYLYDQGAIKREMFEGVYGGNVLDDEHLGNFLKAFENVPITHTAAAAFFYKEHVTAVLRVPKSNNGARGFEYHFVDSMPGARGYATRTACKDINALSIYIKLYALNKFAARDVQYVDKNPLWSDLQAEFDPRVFQAYLWRNERK